MSYFLRIMRAEALKQHRVYFHSPMIYFSMFLWPILELLTAIYIFKPFTANEANYEVVRQYLGGGSVEGFLLLLGGNFWDISHELVDIVILIVIMLAASYLLLNLAERLAKRAGTLTLF